jgi:hypothetical protein
MGMDMGLGLGMEMRGALVPKWYDRYERGTRPHISDLRIDNHQPTEPPQLSTLLGPGPPLLDSDQ